MKKIAAILYSIFLYFNVSAQQAILQDGLALKYLVQLPSEKSAHPPVLILLHGYGSDEKDLFELRIFFPKNYIIISARAPYKLPNGGYQWYEMIQPNGVHDGDAAQLANSRALIGKFITQIISKYQANPKDVYLAGFSQGAIMSYQVGLTSPSTLRGIGVLSGMIYPSLKPLVKKPTALKQLKIFIAHGNVDDRIPFADGKAAYDYLKHLGLNPDFHMYPGMGHTISKEVLTDFTAWLKK